MPHTPGNPYSVEGNMGPFGIGPQGGGMGRGQGNWLSNALSWQIPGSQNIPRYGDVYSAMHPDRPVPDAGYLDTLMGMFAPGVETQRMAEQGANPWALAGMGALDLPLIGPGFKGAKAAFKGTLPSGISSAVKYPFQQGANLMANLRGDPRLVPLRYGNLPQLEGTQNLLADRFPGFQGIDPTITTYPTTPYVHSRNWLTGAEEPGISVYQGLSFPKGSKDYLNPNPFIVERPALNIDIPIPSRGSANNPATTQQFFWNKMNVHHPRTGLPAYQLDADFIPGVQGSDLEAMVNPTSIRGGKPVGDIIERPGFLTRDLSQKEFDKYTTTGQLINPPWYSRPGNVPISVPAATAAIPGPIARIPTEEERTNRGAYLAGQSRRGGL